MSKSLPDNPIPVKTAAKKGFSGSCAQGQKGCFSDGLALAVLSVIVGLVQVSFSSRVRQLCDRQQISFRPQLSECDQGGRKIRICDAAAVLGVFFQGLALGTL